ncbi:NUDIX hydrolase [Tepidimicrobium xylanilyticum]|uniref:ADP-ribose pyrophosphatase n=1 Tax=Tepidimicrobium xylanilyticum TaxID=1123352 RepID=A0A1H3CTP3_9FIRM|nr:NUDIX hydrolase [Tepidimicrobium xylanilyticum]GMG97734.1 ADP-ribose pyrophosphatase [Tepidimicrobium xylanilyticum]SDX57485.1 ADP-ribose pyrophosphatase [Tepidimicrobium xylanilyticum]
MNYEEKTMKSERVYEGKIVNLRVDTVELPGKKYSKREIVEHPGAVGIIPIKEDGSLILVKQYRKPVEKMLLEIPAGKIEINEEPKETAIRELIEETGFKANKMEYILEFYTSPGFTNEKVYLFLATDLEFVKQDPDENEYIQVKEIPIHKLIDMVNKGEITDSKTIISIFFAKKYLDSK